MNHLTDDEIQKYLDNSTEKDVKNISKHLEDCGKCQKQVKAYEKVYENINHEPKFSVSASFIDHIVNNIESSEDRKYRKWEFILFVFTILQGLGLAYYFIDFKKILPNFSTGSMHIFQSISNKISGIGNGTLPLLLFAIIIIGFYGFIDRVLDQYKNYQSSLK